VESVVMQGKMQLNNEKLQIIKDAKKEVADIVVIATKKIIGGAMTKEVDKKIVEEAIREI